MSGNIQTDRRTKIISPAAPNFLLRCFQLIIILLFQVYALHFIFQSPSQSPSSVYQNAQPNVTGKCDHGLVYVYELPPIFNKELLDNCHDLDPWQSRCNAIANNGLGPTAAGISGLPGNLSAAWYWTDMFAGEVIYHARVLEHECRTMEPESAVAFYIPFYAGFAVAKYLFTNYTAKERDWHCERLLGWVREQPLWMRSNGSDHFIMLGRMTWDFRRSNDGDWGSSFIYMPLMKRITRLTVERDPWDVLEISVPYPTGFHPKSKSEIDQWVEFIRSSNRKNLFTFVGGRRRIKNDFRTILLNQCHNETNFCRVVDCSSTKCYDGTSEIIEAFLSSDFCLQPRGDAHTKRSTFDCLLAGSIPVFFWRRSIYHQYELFLGNEPGEFSVFIDRRGVRNGTSVRLVLESYSKYEVERMRNRVISLIPSFIYSLDSGSHKDAFDIAIDGVLERFHEQRLKPRVIIKCDYNPIIITFFQKITLYFFKKSYYNSILIWTTCIVL